METVDPPEKSTNGALHTTPWMHVSDRPTNCSVLILEEFSPRGPVLSEFSCFTQDLRPPHLPQDRGEQVVPEGNGMFAAVHTLRAASGAQAYGEWE